MTPIPEIPNHCTPCSRYTLTCTNEDIVAFQPQIPSWRPVVNYGLQRSFIVSSFAKACKFLGEYLAPLCDKEDHHPNVEIRSYGQEGEVILEITFSTYFRGPRLTMNDFVMAKLVDKILAEEY